MTTRLIGVDDVAPASGIAEFRTRENSGCDQFVINEQERVASFKGFATTFRYFGVVATTANLFYMKNGDATKLVAIRQLQVGYDETLTNFGTWQCQFACSRPAADATGGTAPTKVALDTALSSAAGVVMLGPCSSDQTNVNTPASTAIVCTPGTLMYRQRIQGTPVAANTGQIRRITERQNAFAAIVDRRGPLSTNDYNDFFMLRPGERLLVSAFGSDSGQLDTVGILTSIVWEEFDLP